MSVELQDFWYNFIILNLGDLSNLIGCYKTKKKEKNGNCYVWYCFFILQKSWEEGFGR